MLDDFFSDKICSSCSHIIPSGYFFCRYCGRGRGNGKYSQLKKWELLFSGSIVMLCALAILAGSVFIKVNALFDSEKYFATPVLFVYSVTPNNIPYPVISATLRQSTPTPTFFAFTPRPSLTNTLRPTSTKTPRPTSTYTPKPTKSTSCSDISLSDTYTKSKGVFVHVTLCDKKYDVGPFSLGKYQISPNQKFFVYVAADYDGSVYVSKIGSPNVKKIGKLRQDFRFKAFFRNESPSYRLTVTNSSVTIYEADFGDTGAYNIPSSYSK